MSARIHDFPAPARARRRHMARFLECAARCYSAAADEAEDPATAASLTRAAERYMGGFRALAEGRAA
jgi:hypothetical protein